MRNEIWTDVSKELAIATSRFAEFGTGSSSFHIMSAFRKTEETTQAGRYIRTSHITEFFVETWAGNRLLQIKRTGEGKNEIDKEREIREKLFAYIRERLSQKFGAQVIRAFMERFLGFDRMGSYNPKDGSLRIGQFHVNYSSDLAGKAIIFNGCLIRLVDAPVNASELEWKKIPLVSAAVPPDKKLGPPDSFFH